MMVIPKDCSLWINQRLSKGLSDIKETGISVRKMSRDISLDLNKRFDINVKPDTIRSRAMRMSSPISQNVVWGRAVRDLAKITSYMMENCEISIDIDNETIDNVYRHIDTLQTFVDELEKEAANGL